MCAARKAQPKRPAAQVKGSVFRLRTKIVLTFLLPGVLTLLLIWYAALRLREGLDAQLGRRLISVAQAAVPMLPGDLVTMFQAGDRSTRTYRNLRRKLLRLKRATGVRRIYVFNKRKRSLLDTDIVPIGKEYFQLSFDAVELEQVFVGKARASLLFRDLRGVWYKTGFAPIKQDGKVVASVGVEGSASFFVILQGVLQSFYVFALLSLLFVVFGGWLVSRWVVTPVYRLVDAARAIGGGELGRPIQVMRRDEIGFLAETMEEMRKNIMERDSQMQMMLSGIAHEVRNPLGGMELFTGILQEELAGDDEKLSHVNRIQRELRYLANVVTSFLDYARPTVLDIRKHDWQDFLFELKMLLAGDLEKKKLNVKCEGDEEAGSFAFDRSRIQQTFLNMLQNAIHASPEEGEIRVLTEAKDEGFLISIKDEGKGISAAHLEKIFEPFFTTKEKGTGLGLPLAKKFVESHGGTLAIESEEGEGTTIKIWLPKEPAVAGEDAMNMMLGDG